MSGMEIRDKWFYIEILYRTLVLAMVTIPSFYAMSMLVGYCGVGVFWDAIKFAMIWLWVIFEISVISWLVLVASGTFRPKTPEELLEEEKLLNEEEDDDENEDDEELPEELGSEKECLK